MTPSMPIDTWAAASRSGVDPSTTNTSPRPSTKRHDRIDAEKLCRPTPDPCVAVPIAPAIPWVSMSPWFASARPASQSGSPKAPIGVPGSARTRPAAASTCVMPPRLARSISVPSVRCTGEKECPAATTRTPCPAATASRTAACTSASLAGERRRAGVQRRFPTQFTNVAPICACECIAAHAISAHDPAVTSAWDRLTAKRDLGRCRVGAQSSLCMAHRLRACAGGGARGRRSPRRPRGRSRPAARTTPCLRQRMTRTHVDRGVRAGLRTGCASAFDARLSRKGVQKSLGTCLVGEASRFIALAKCLVPSACGRGALPTWVVPSQIDAPEP